MGQAGQLVNAHGLAGGMGLSVSRVHQLVGLGMPKRARGKYDLVECLKWLVKFQRDLISRHETESGSTSADLVRRQRARLLEVRTQQAEAELAAQQGTLIPLEVFSAQMSAMISIARQQLLQLPARIAPGLEGEPRHIIQHKLKLAIHAALTALAQGGMAREAIPADPRPPAASNGNAEGNDSGAGPIAGAEI